FPLSGAIGPVCFATFRLAPSHFLVGWAIVDTVISGSIAYATLYQSSVATGTLLGRVFTSAGRC
ncbi:MAG: hypothetical protein QOF73_1588, partial [Thermomicrobiales bacterium]|nr:hypothetical protein [Thermomicrobiales bacterium]